MAEPARDQGVGAPQPEGARTLDDLATALVALRAWAGSPSYAEIGRRIKTGRAARGLPASEQAAGRVTIYDCFRSGRTRLDIDLVCDIVAALGASADVPHWRLAHAALTSSDRSNAATASVTRGLPAPQTPLIGRSAELAALAASEAQVQVVSGMPGAGKTELALTHAATLCAAYDDCYFVNLHGYDAELRPVTPHDALGSLLRLLGEAGTRVLRLDTKQRIAAIRHRVSGRRVLVVLDNARDHDHVRPLLDALREARVVITSRRQLNVGDSVDLEPLSDADALALLEQLAPEVDLASQPEATRRLIEMSGRLPLPLTLIAVRLAEFPHWSISDQVQRLEAVAPVEAIQRALETSYDTLAPDVAAFLRALPLHPGERVCLHSAAAVAGVTPAWAAEATRRLHEEHLVIADPKGCVVFHDLVREFTLRKGRDIDPHSQRLEAVRRLLNYYRAAVTAATTQLKLVPAEPPSAASEVTRVALPEWSVEAEVREWLATEIAPMLTLASVAGDLDCVDGVAHLANALAPWLEAETLFQEEQGLFVISMRSTDARLRGAAVRGLARVGHLSGDYDDALRWAQHGVELSAEDEAAVAYLELGQALMRLSRLAEARDAFREAVSAARAGGQAVEEGRGLAGEALSIQLLGDFAGAVPLFVQASEIAERTADLEGLVMANGNLAYQFLLAEQYDRAEDALRTCLRIEQQLGLSQHEPYTLAYLGDLRSMRGDHTEGLSLLNRALELAGPSYPRCESQVLIRRGDVELRMGEPHAALASYSRADEILREFSSTWVEIDCNNGLAETRLALGDPETAALLFQRARAASDEVGDPYESARALVGLGEIALQAGNVEVALEQWEAAALLFARLGSPAADRLSARVAELRGAS